MRTLAPILRETNSRVPSRARSRRMKSRITFEALPAAMGKDTAGQWQAGQPIAADFGRGNSCLIPTNSFNYLRPVAANQSLMACLDT